jgi:hypothetical protein
MPDKVFAEVDAVVAKEPHPPHMYKLQQCLQPISKDMEAAYVEAGAAEADARNNNIPTAVFLLHREWAMCFPRHMQCPPPAGGGGNMYSNAPQGGIPGYAPHGGMQPQERPPYSNLVKRFANWNACYTCGFDVPDGHTSMTCQAQRKAGHYGCFTRQNAQQYIDAGWNCSTRNRHKTQFLAM